MFNQFSQLTRCWSALVAEGECLKWYNRNMAINDGLRERLASVTEDELVRWFGKRVATAAQTNIGKVQKLRVAPDGSLLATMNGTATYTTRVLLTDAGVKTKCSCPCWFDCKHAATVIMAARRMAKKDQRFSAVSKLDDRLQEVPFEGESIEIPARSEAEQLAVDAKHAVREALATPGRDETWEYYERKNRFWEDEDDEFYDEDEYVPPDYKSVRGYFELLASGGQTRVLQNLADEIMQKSPAQLDSADDAWEIADAIRNCLDIARLAILKSSVAQLRRSQFCARVKKWKKEYGHDD